MKAEVEALIRRLKDRGLKATPQRRRLLEALLANEREMSAEEILQAVRADFPEFGIDTVYRNLRVLVDQGIVQELRGQGKARYRRNPESHRHRLLCLDCGREEELAYCPIGDLAAAAAREYGFAVAHHRLEMFGYCPNCRPRATP